VPPLGAFLLVRVHITVELGEGLQRQSVDQGHDLGGHSVLIDHSDSLRATPSATKQQ